jgi:hypothetical protein
MEKIILIDEQGIGFVKQTKRGTLVKPSCWLGVL